MRCQRQSDDWREQTVDVDESIENKRIFSMLLHDHHPYLYYLFSCLHFTSLTSSTLLSYLVFYYPHLFSFLFFAFLLFFFVPSPLPLLFSSSLLFCLLYFSFLLFSSFIFFLYSSFLLSSLPFSSLLISSSLLFSSLPLLYLHFHFHPSSPVNLLLNSEN